MARLGRYLFIFGAIYFIMLGGSPYYFQFFFIRSLHHIVVTLVIGAWLLRRLWKKRALPTTPLNLLIYLTLGVWLLSALTSLDTRTSYEALWFPLTHVLLFFIIADQFQAGRERLVIETQFLVAGLVVVMAGLQLASWYFGLGLVPGTSIGWVSVLGQAILLPLTSPGLYLPLGVTTWLSAYTAPLVIVSAGWAWTTRQRSSKIIFALLSAALFAVMIFTASRGGLISLAVAISVIVFLRFFGSARVRQLSRRQIALLILLPVAVISIFGIIVLVSSQAEGHATGDTLRLSLWQGAAEMIRDHPLLGVGPGLFGRAFRLYRDPIMVDDRLGSAHNALLHTGAETGLLGLLVSVALGMAVLWAWRKKWHDEPSLQGKLRLEIVLAGLLGIGAQSFFDLFTATPLVLLVLFLVTYSTIQKRSSAQHEAIGKWPLSTAAALIGLSAYGIAFIGWDQAQNAFQRSLQPREDALAQAQTAVHLDPAMRLYELQVRYLTGQSADTETAISAYKAALDLEPTWDTGWINLAALEARQGNIPQALGNLERAKNINNANVAALNWARLAEAHQAALAQAIIDHYLIALRTTPHLPLSAFWQETPLRREALETYLASGVPLDIQYRILAIHAPDRLAALLPQTPVSAEDWWVTGEYALTMTGDSAVAIQAFSEAIGLAPTQGDYYASRARAEINSNPEAARQDLNLAYLLKTTHEYPNAIQVALAGSAEEVHDLRVNALPQRFIEQNFEGVSFLGRTASFELFTEMRAPGPGTAAMQPWYDLANDYLTNGETEKAANVYRAILDYAPDEHPASEALTKIMGS